MKSPALKWTLLILFALFVASGIAYVVAPKQFAKVVPYAPKPVEGNWVIKVTDMEGKPIPGTKISVSSEGRYTQKYADKEGKYVATIQKGGNETWVRANAPGHVSLYGKWGSGEAPWSKFEDELHLKLKKGTEAGGTVTDTEGNPVFGAKISATMRGEKKRGEPIHEWHYNAIAQTDQNGKWKLNVVPEKLGAMTLSIEHPAFLAKQRSFNIRESEFDGLRKFTDVRVMEPGVAVTGTVRDSDGNPIQGAYVTPGRSPWEGRRRQALIRKTNSAGKFSFKGCEPGNSFLTVLAKGYAPEVQKVKFEEGMNPVVFRLNKGKTVQLKVVDKNKEPVQNADVYPNQFQGIYSLREIFRQVYKFKTDQNGILEWDGAPDEGIDFYAYKRGYTTTSTQTIKPSDKPYEFVLRLPLKLKGTVVDAETGSPIQNFTFEPGRNQGNNNIYWQDYRRKSGNDGSFDMTINENGTDRKYAVRVSAKGYYPSVSRMFSMDEEGLELEFKLEKGVGPKGTVQDADGNPVENAQVASYTKDQRTYLNDGEVRERQGGSVSLTDAKGDFALDPVTEEFGIVAVHETGVAIMEQEEFENSKVLKLEPWATVHGKVMIGKEPGANSDVTMNLNRVYQQNKPYLSVYYRAKADDDGSFSFEKVVPGNLSLSRQVKYEADGGGTYYQNANTEYVDVNPGEDVSVTLGGKGRPVIGKVDFPEGLREKLDMRYQHYSIQQMMDPVAVSNSGSSSSSSNNPLISGINTLFGGSSRTKKTATSTPERPRRMKYYNFRLEDDNTFRIEDVVPGKYRINMYFQYRQGVDGVQQYTQAGTINEEFTIEEIPDGRSDDPLDLGELKILSREEQQAQYRKRQEEAMKQRKELMEKRKAALEKKKKERAEKEKAEATDETKKDADTKKEEADKSEASEESKESETKSKPAETDENSSDSVKEAEEEKEEPAASESEDSKES